MHQGTPSKRETGVWSRLKSLVTGGASELEAERNNLYEQAKHELQRQVEAGKITADELEYQLELLRRTRTNRNGHEQPPAQP